MADGKALKKKKKDSHHAEAWYTPPHVVEFHVAVVRRLLGPEVRKLVDPFAGDGRYMAAAERVWPHAHTRSDDLDGGGKDYAEATERYRDAVVITNPAFSLAAKAAQCAIESGALAVSFLLPVSFVDPWIKNRRDLLQAYPPQHEVKIGRIKFHGPALEHHLAENDGKAPGAMQAYQLTSWIRPGVPWMPFGQTVTHYCDPRDRLYLPPEARDPWPGV